ncbi:putative CDP-alcohol phosphatidyltransferase class-I family protein C22A12.10 [Golovinomyces cichoracearum]|uniref:diacylglycerol cholinephosphotransferase n=1 Tax=Golovinomyces cichoracearum TaxID=62708 RepID=A0A420IGV9_9PEZI|nr:putative CDP-alcohol phosphatidyltransferase class-I family protein C22A12.10 [Golovinomyces cichoracearum]
MAYIRQAELPNLKNYRYSGVDHSLISYYVLKPFYNKVVIKCFPMRMAPNLITLSGFGFIIINVLTLFYYNPTLDHDCPPWVYVSWAVGLFLYQTFDAVDGAQARRTHQSGPLGELFDHGVDALNTSLGVLIFAASLNLGMGWKTIMALFSAQLTFYVQTWEEYHTKTLTLGIVNGPVEGVLILISIYLFTAFKGGASFWQQSVFDAIGLKGPVSFPSRINNLIFNDLFLIQGALVLIINIIQSCVLQLPPLSQNVLELSKSSSINVVQVRKARGEKSRVALRGILPFATIWTLISIYLYLNQKILYHNLVPFIIFTGLVNSYSVGLMITAHLAQLPFPQSSPLTWPLFYGIFDSLGPLSQKYLGLGWPSLLCNDEYQVAYCYCMLGCAIGVYGSFVVDVIVTICDYLDIWCLTIKHPWNEKELSEKKKST